MLGSGIAMWQICCMSMSVSGVVQHVRSRCPCSGVWHLSPQLSRKWRSCLFLNIFSHVELEVTICTGKQFQLSHSLLEKANFPISKLYLLLYNFNEWPLLSSNAKVKKLILIDTISIIHLISSALNPLSS